MTDKTLKKLEQLARKHLDPETQGRCRHFSFAVGKGGRIIAFEKNNINKTCTYHDINGFKYPFCHSETYLIKRLKSSDIDFRKVTLVVIRIGGEDDTLIMSKPCKKCQEVIKKFNFRNVLYSTDEGTLKSLVGV